jgi:hypothetical protein
MVKSLNCSFDDDVFDRLDSIKSVTKLSWEQFILMVVDRFDKGDKNE